MKRLSDQPELRIKAYSMHETLYKGPAYSLQATNRTGPFAVLPGHANLLTVLTDGTVVIDTANGEKELSVTNGMLRVYNNQVSLFADL